MSINRTHEQDYLHETQHTAIGPNNSTRPARMPGPIKCPKNEIRPVPPKAADDRGQKHNDPRPQQNAQATVCISGGPVPHVHIKSYPKVERIAHHPRSTSNTPHAGTACGGNPTSTRTQRGQQTIPEHMYRATRKSKRRIEFTPTTCNLLTQARRQVPGGRG